MIEREIVLCARIPVCLIERERVCFFLNSISILSNIYGCPRSIENQLLRTLIEEIKEDKHLSLRIDSRLELSPTGRQTVFVHYVGESS